MFKKHLFMKLTACILIVVLVVVLTVFASGAGTTAGTASDPLVTQSYVDETFRAELLQQLQQSLSASQSELNQTMNAMLERIGNQSVGYVPVSDVQTGYVSVTVLQGETLLLSPGQQFLVLSGSGAVSLNMVVDTTAGRSLSAGYAISENHFYTVPAEAAISASADMSILLQ